LLLETIMAHVIRSATACLLALATSLTCLSAAAQSTPTTGGDANVSQVAARQQAQEIANGDPARWYRNDSEQQTLRKELRAALQQPAADRKACVAEARATFQRDSGLLTKAPSN
jgi:hypothetical protein